MLSCLEHISRLYKNGIGAISSSHNIMHAALLLRFTEIPAAVLPPSTGYTSSVTAISTTSTAVNDIAGGQTKNLSSTFWFFRLSLACIRGHCCLRLYSLAFNSSGGHAASSSPYSAHPFPVVIGVFSRLTHNNRILTNSFDLSI